VAVPVGIRGLLAVAPVRPEVVAGVDELAANEDVMGKVEDPDEAKLGAATAWEGSTSEPVPQGIGSRVPG